MIDPSLDYRVIGEKKMSINLIDETLLALQEMFGNVLRKNKNFSETKTLKDIYHIFKHPDNENTNTFQILYDLNHLGLRYHFFSNLPI